jgi:hypothetical protein
LSQLTRPDRNREKPEQTDDSGDFGANVTGISPEFFSAANVTGTFGQAPRAIKRAGRGADHTQLILTAVVVNGQFPRDCRTNGHARARASPQKQGRPEALRTPGPSKLIGSDLIIDDDGQTLSPALTSVNVAGRCLARSTCRARRPA